MGGYLDGSWELLLTGQLLGEMVLALFSTALFFLCHHLVFNENVKTSLKRHFIVYVKNFMFSQRKYIKCLIVISFEG